MSTSVHDVFEAFRQAPSNYERGAKFEKLMAQYLPLDPVYGRLFDQVWMWKDWPGRDGKVDTGIDLVAQEADTGDLWAIQCKFYEPEHTLARGDIDSFLARSGQKPFRHRLIVSTTDRWGKHAEAACENQQIPVQRIGLADIAESPIDWAFVGPDITLDVDLKPAPKHEPRPHQQEAIDKVFAGFAEHDRGKLIMACGTGKTFTALKAAERTAAENGGAAKVLFLVPSISLLSQTLREWTAQCQLDLRSFAVCSDTKVSRAVEDINPHDVPLPATTDPATLIEQTQHRKRAKGLTVVFSTYQSIGVIAEAQDQGLDEFDLIICDEAHRTTGVTLADADESNFVKVHAQDYIRGYKRLYMTATPRLFAEETKTKATEKAAVLASMDDEDLYGPEFHRLGFGDAVERGLLTDYKVLVLTVDEKYIAGPLQRQLADDNQELNLDDATKIVGCWNGLAKRTGEAADGASFGTSARPMQRAVAFLRDIKSSKKLADKFDTVIGAYDEADDDILRCEVEHVDGTYNALERNHRLQWLKAPLAENQCRILSNARCLSEGVDVPGLDAVLFLNPRNSVVDVVQSVGRVMRKAEGKEYGYIILPVGVPAGMAPSEALADNKRFKVVWQVLQALRAHDDRFNATVNKLELNKKKAAESILVGHVSGPADEAWADTAAGLGSETGAEGGTAGASGPDAVSAVAEQLGLFEIDEWRDAIYAKIVDKVGTRTYWEDWAKDVADIARAQETRIRALLQGANADVTAAFERFVDALKANLNDSIHRDQAIEMLCQHLITKPVFDALFEDYDFASHNPVSKVMQAMVDTLHDASLEAETEKLEGFYASVRMRADGIDNAEGKQRIIVELYEKFFRLGFKKAADAMGIVYTPIPIVDFIIRAADDALKAEFGKSLTDEGVHILDPFTGTGTFITRLLQSGIIRPEDMLRKYTSELHANEILLLAYYIAAINIEATFHGLHGGSYQPFEGIVLTDTFQIAEDGDTMDADMFPQNNARILRQQASPIRVIIGNPPYSVGQDSANDDNANVKYPTLDSAIERTYAARSTAISQRTLYDSYVRAIRWATDRVGDSGIVAYVSNGGWIEGNTADGIRLALADEFSTLYVYNLRGNQRTAGEQSRKEGGKVFGSGSRNTVAILIAIKNPAHTGTCRIRYRDIGDYLTRDEKLDLVGVGGIANIDWLQITPNAEGDWINQRSAAFITHVAIGEKVPKGAQKPITVFSTYSLGLATGRDAWAYNYSRNRLDANVRRMIDAYNAEVDRYQSSTSSGLNPEVEKFINADPTKISWNRNAKADLVRGNRYVHNQGAARVGMYRPFCKQSVYFDGQMNAMRYQIPRIFPTPEQRNSGFYVTGAGSDKPFSALMTDLIPDLSFWGSSSGQYFPRWTYEGVAVEDGQIDFGESVGDGSGYRKIDNITDLILAAYRKAFGDDVTKDDIFHYVYGVLQSPQYRSEFAADLKKMLPRIPKVATSKGFQAFAQAGRDLAVLHVGYESVEPYPLAETVKSTVGADDRELYRVGKMKFKSKTDKSTLVYNAHITLSGIPDEAHRYMLGSRSAIEWLIDRYQVKTDPKSGIVNDPNDWCDEHDDPRYIVDLVKRIVTVSVETMKIVDNLPTLDLS
ncbi:DEAD/DEAH box helicase [Rhodococcus sp. SJ-3]|uniref:DEAD/DEAH box helicase n=1 Tax=Rhodococcus sp. SJ-3 TaxID=3454628 RepID=UPI003F7A4B93